VDACLLLDAQIVRMELDVHAALASVLDGEHATPQAGNDHPPCDADGSWLASADGFIKIRRQSVRCAEWRAAFCKAIELSASGRR